MVTTGSRPPISVGAPGPDFVLPVVNQDGGGYRVARGVPRQDAGSAGCVAMIPVRYDP